jgi:hypothetical protein
MKKRVCPHCKQEFSPDRFHPEQVVCSFPLCQRRRRTEYHRRKIEADPAYRALREDSRTYWNERNPDYQKQYRARTKGEKTVGNKLEGAREEVLRLLRSVKNTSGKNNSAPTVSRCLVAVLLAAAGDASTTKNNLATTKLIVFQGDLNGGG